MWRFNDTQIIHERNRNAILTLYFLHCFHPLRFGPSSSAVVQRNPTGQFVADQNRSVERINSGCKCAITPFAFASFLKNSVKMCAVFVKNPGWLMEQL